jgi:hypothetical protein
VEKTRRSLTTSAWLAQQVKLDWLVTARKVKTPAATPSSVAQIKRFGVICAWLALLVRTTHMGMTPLGTIPVAMK